MTIKTSSPSNGGDGQVLPEKALYRLPRVLGLVPVSKTTWYRWIAEGKAPAPIKLGEKTTVWKSEDIFRFIDDATKEGRGNE
jgi:prophage regulatory protein